MKNKETKLEKELENKMNKKNKRNESRQYNESGIQLQNEFRNRQMN